MDRIHLPVNPQPWRAPTGSVVKYGGQFRVAFTKDAKLETFQRAIMHEATKHELDVIDADLRVHFTFFRNMEQGAQIADATNLLKATEDALQSILYVNDRRNVSVSSTILVQAPDTIPAVVIEWEEFEMNPHELALMQWHKSLQPVQPPSNEYLPTKEF